MLSIASSGRFGWRSAAADACAYVIMQEAGHAVQLRFARLARDVFELSSDQARAQLLVRGKLLERGDHGSRVARRDE